jgi:aryl-alcohol dehydrogenase-like predicted oxidoreductase
MEYRQLHGSDIKASAITFGAWAIGGWMWGGTDMNESIAAIHASFDQGVTSIDTAAVYGYGLSEKITGEALKTLPRDKVQLMTKCGLRWDLQKGDYFFSFHNEDGSESHIYKYSGKESIIEECENSLKRLGTDYIDLYQIHWYDVTTPLSEAMEAMDILLKQGKIRAAGVSNFTAAQMAECEKTVKLISNQVPFSMVERSIEAELVPYCIANQKSILAYSPLQRGLLAGKIKPGHQFKVGDSRSGNRFYKTENLERINTFLDNLLPLAQDKNCTLSQLVIAWTLKRPGITVALVGARDAAQATENAKAGEIKLTEEEIAIIDSHLSKLELIG